MVEVRPKLPAALRQRATWERLGPSATPALLALPEGATEDAPAPLVLWMHGRTVHKELDPGRYLRWLRAGIGACALDLPGHGERLDRELQRPERTLDVVRAMVDEIDGVVDAVRDRPGVDADRLGIGGMSAGGMVTLVRLGAPHPFRAASVEATTGSWEHQRGRAMHRPDLVEAMNPIEHLEGWREIPLQVIHSKADEWVAFEGQMEFVDALRDRYERPDLVEVVAFERTGAPHEHVGFGRKAAEAKDAQTEFFRRCLIEPI